VECDGQFIHLYRDIEKTVKQLQKISPADGSLLRKLTRDVKATAKMQMPVFDIKGVKAKNPKRMTFGFLHNMLHALPVIRRLSKINCYDYAMRFRHPGIQRLLRVVPDQYTASSLIFTLATLHAGDGGYPDGGSLAMVHRMAKKFTDTGGTLMLNTQVQKIIVHSGNVSGVLLRDGAMDADAVIVTQETIAALEGLFETPPKDTWINELRANVDSAICTFISVGVRAELPDGLLPEWKLEKPITFADQTIPAVSFYSYRRYAPEGGTALTTISFGDTYDFWKQAKDDGRYEEEKQILAEQFSSALCAKYPQCEGKIEVIDIATPLTYERYTGAYRGSWMSVMKPGDKMKQYPGNCEGINGLFFAGHRLMPPGGLPSAAASGRQAAQMVCRLYDVQFV
jgi:phytoene dehydrogenase-like protein